MEFHTVGILLFREHDLDFVFAFVSVITGVTLALPLNTVSVGVTIALVRNVHLDFVITSLKTIHTSIEETSIVSWDLEAEVCRHGNVPGQKAVQGGERTLLDVEVAVGFRGGGPVHPPKHAPLRLDLDVVVLPLMDGDGILGFLSRGEGFVVDAAIVPTVRRFTVTDRAFTVPMPRAIIGT